MAVRQRGSKVSDTHPSGQARGSRDLFPMEVKSYSIQKYLKVCTNVCRTVVSMNRIADVIVGYASACSCFWPG